MSYLSLKSYFCIKMLKFYYKNYFKIYVYTKKKGGGVCTHLKFFFYIGSKAINSDELSDARARGEQMVSKQSEFSDVAGEDINGDNFVMKDGSKARTDYNVKVTIDDWVKELAQINNNELSANLFILKNKHPELFDSPANVYRTLIEIKNNPTHFFKNNRPDMSLISKILKDGSIGKIGVVKQTGQVGHLNISKRKNEINRLKNVNKRELGVGSPYPTQQSNKMLPANGDGAKAHSLATNESIPQKTKSQIIDDISDDNFVMKEASQEPQRNIMQTFTPDEWINKLSEILPDEWVANLTKLAKKHPEMFKSEADVFKVIKQIKDNPTHFFKNYDDKFVNIGIKKENGEIIHANKNKTKDLERLQRRNNEMLTGTPLPATTQSKASMGGDLLQHSDKNIVTQKAKNDINGDKQENNINQIVKSISNNSDIALELKPKTDLLSIIQDFKEPIKTPIFEAKISLDKLLNHLAQKEDNKRLGYINLIKPTLEKPLFITKQDDRYRFVKTFLDDDKVIKYLSVIENENGDFIGITALPIKNTDLKNLLSKEEIVWGGDTLSALSTPQIAKQEAEAMSKMVSQKSLNKDKDLERLSRKQKEIYKNKGVVAPATALKNKADGELLNTKPSNKIIPQKATNEVLLKNDFENIKTFDDVKNNFLADMKLKDDDITLQNTKKTWSDELYGKKDSTALKINGKKVPLSEVEQYALKNEIDPIKKEILKKEIIYEKLKDDFTKKQKELSKIKNEKDLQKSKYRVKRYGKKHKRI